jgi:hypothetical protein
MTDPTPRDLDQLASDLVDGLLPNAEAARARNEPEIAARVARIEQMRSALQSVPRAAPSQVARAVSAAVAAAAAEENPTRSVVQPLRRARRPLGERARPWLAAAAVIVVAGMAIAGLSRLDPSDDEDQASDAPTAAESPREQDEATADEGSAFDSDDSSGDQGTAKTTIAGGGDLGAAANADELAALVAQDAGTLVAESEDDLDRTPGGGGGDQPVMSAPEAAERTADSCPGRSDVGDTSHGTSIYTADAPSHGAPVRVHVYERDGETYLVATDHACTDVVDQPFTP